jgi:hypothetical protein
LPIYNKIDKGGSALIDGISGTDRISSNFAPNPNNRRSRLNQKNENQGMSFEDIVKVRIGKDGENDSGGAENKEKEKSPANTLAEKNEEGLKKQKDALFSLAASVFYTEAKNAGNYGTDTYKKSSWENGREAFASAYGNDEYGAKASGTAWSPSSSKCTYPGSAPSPGRTVRDPAGSGRKPIPRRPG